MLFLIIFIVVLFVLVRFLGRPVPRAKLYNLEVNKIKQQKNIIKKHLDEQKQREVFNAQRRQEYQNYLASNIATVTKHPGNGSCPDYLEYVISFIRKKLGNNWSFISPTARKRILFNEFSHAEKFGIICHDTGKEYELSFRYNKLEIKPINSSPSITNDDEYEECSGKSSDKERSPYGTKGWEINMKPTSNNAKNPSLEECDLKKIAKNWLENNLDYMNTVIGTGSSNSAPSVVFEKTRLPKNKKSWEYIGKSLTDDNEFSSYEVKEDLVLFF